MKKLFIIALASLFAFASCSKESNETPEVNNGKDVVLTFKSKRPQLKSETKTAWDATNEVIVWSTTDKIRVGYTLDGNWMGQIEAGTAKFYASKEVTIDGNVGTFQVPITGGGITAFTDPETAGTYKFYAIYPSTLIDATVNDPTAKNITLAPAQTPGANTFDSTTDVMVGASESMNISGLPTDPISLSWTRVVAHADLTFSNMAFEGTETPIKITLTFNEAAKVAGTFSINITDGSIGEGTANEITLEGSGLTVNTNSIKVWATVLPVSFSSLNVEVKTDKATYTRSISGISKTFKQNARNTLTINMENANRQTLALDAYALYSGDITEGDYIVFYNGKAMKAEVSNSRLQYAEVTPFNDVISTNNESIVWHIAASSTNGYWTIYNVAETKYAAATGSKNQAALLDSGTDDKSLWFVTGSSTYEFVNKAREAASSDSGNKYLRNNGTNGFACYASGTGGALSLYKKDSRTPLSAPTSVTAALNSANNTVIDVTFTTVSGASSYGIIATPTSGGDPIVKNVTSSPATITVSDDGLAYNTEYTISVYAVPSDATAYRESSATAGANTVTTGANYDFTTITELNGLVTSTSATYYGHLTNAIVSFVPNTGTAIVKDATGSVMIYKSGHGLKQGQTYSGAIGVTAIKYNSLYSEITAWTDATFTGSQATVAPENVSLTDLTGNYDDYQNAYVSAAGLTVSNIDGKNINVTDGTNTYVVYYNPSGTIPCGAGDEITAIGTITKFGSTEEIKVWSSDDITITSNVDDAITFEQPASGGSFTVSMGGSPITSGTHVSSGTTITLTATAASGYTFGGWTVTGATVADANATTTTFTMGTAAVSISAKFNSTSGTTYTKVTTAPSDWSGIYIIVYEEPGFVCLAGTDDYHNYTTATISSGVITSNDLSDYEVEIASYSTGYSIKAKGGTNANKYIEGKGSSSNGTNFKDSPTKATTFTLSEGAVTITNNTNLFVYNATSGANGERFRFYKSVTVDSNPNTYKKPALYKKN